MIKSTVLRCDPRQRQQISGEGDDSNANAKRCCVSKKSFGFPGQENQDLALLTSQGDAFATSGVLEVLPMPDTLGERPHRQVVRAGQEAALYSASLPKRQISSCSSSLMNKKCS